MQWRRDRVYHRQHTRANLVLELLLILLLILLLLMIQGGVCVGGQKYRTAAYKKGWGGRRENGREEMVLARHCQSVNQCRLLIIGVVMFLSRAVPPPPPPQPSTAAVPSLYGCLIGSSHASDCCCCCYYYYYCS